AAAGPARCGRTASRERSRPGGSHRIRKCRLLRARARGLPGARRRRAAAVPRRRREPPARRRARRSRRRDRRVRRRRRGARMSLGRWLGEPWQRVAARFAQGSLPHALLLAGPPGLGQRAFAERLAALILCHEPGVDPCGRCRSCRLFASRAQRDPEETRPDGALAHPDGHPVHPDGKFVGHAWNEKQKKMYTEIVVEQVRDLSAWLALTAQFGNGQVALIDPADAMNPAAANALLKTLEEPSPGSFVLLVSAHPARIVPTIRSRCQRIDF